MIYTVLIQYPKGCGIKLAMLQNFPTHVVAAPVYFCIFRQLSTNFRHYRYIMQDMKDPTQGYTEVPTQGRWWPVGFVLRSPILG